MAKRRKQKILRKHGLPPGTLVYTGDRLERPAQVCTIRYNANNVSIKDGLELTPTNPTDSDMILWVDVRNLSDVQLVQSLGEQFGLNPLALEDVLNTQQRAKLEDYEDSLFMVLPNLSFDKTSLDIKSEQIAVFVKEAACLTFQEDPDDTFKPLVQRIRDGGGGRVRKKKSDYLFYAIADVIIDNYFIALDQIEDVLLDIENDLYSEGAHETQKARIFQVKYVIGQFRHRVSPLREVVTRLLHSDCTVFEPANEVFIRDLADHVAQVLDKVENFREHIINIEALYHTEINNKLNETMRLLTIISTIFIPLSFVAGVYGMNFDNMPELRTQYGYFVVLGSMFLTFIGMLLYFRVKKWL